MIENGILIINGEMIELSKDQLDLLGFKQNPFEKTKNENLLRQQIYREILNHRLWKFSIENGGDQINWSDIKDKNYIVYDYDIDRFVYHKAHSHKENSTVYFISATIAMRAIEEIVEPFMKEHPDFIW